MKYARKPRPRAPKPPNYKVLVRLDLNGLVPYDQMAKRIEDLLALSFSAKGVKVLNINQSAFRVAMHGGARSETAVGMTS